jgi:hypothetical protein
MMAERSACVSEKEIVLMLSKESNIYEKILRKKSPKIFYNLASTLGAFHWKKILEKKNLSQRRIDSTHSRKEKIIFEELTKPH